MAELLSVLGAGALWILAFIVVVVVVYRLPGKDSFGLSSVLIGYVLFYFAQITLVKVLDLATLLSTPALWAAYIALVIAGISFLSVRRNDGYAVLSLRRVVPNDVEERNIRWIAITCAGAIVGGLAVFALLSPVAVWDVHAYHMPMVASYMQNETLSVGATQDLRQIYRVNGAELQMLNVALLSRSDAWMELPNLLALAVSLVAVFLIGRMVLRREAAAYLTVVLTLTAPQILYGSATAKNDIIFLALILGTFYWVLRIAMDPHTHVRAWVAVLALTVSLAVATKVMGLNVVGTAGLVLLVLVLRRRLPLRRLVLFGGISLAAVLILVGDVYWSNFQQAQVPVGIRPGEVDFIVGASNFAAAAKFYLYDLSFRRLITTQVFEHDFSHFGYFFPFILMLGTVAAVRQMVVRNEQHSAVRVMALLSFTLFLSVILVRHPIQWDQRFMIWMVPAFAVLAGTLVRRWQVSVQLAAISFCSAFALFNVIQMYTNASGGIFPKSSLHLLSNGELPRLADVAHEKYLYKIDGFQLLGEESGERDSILYVGAEDTWMYPAWGRRFTRHVSGVRDSADLAIKMRSGAYAFVVVEGEAADELQHAAADPESGAGYVELYASPQRSILRREHRGSILRLEHRADSAAVDRLTRYR